MVSELRFETKKIRMADLGKESCVPDLLGELTMQNQLEFHLDETDEIYEGYGRVKSAYPYRQRNTYTRELKEMEIHTAVLENRYLKAVFLPEFGGRLWELWDKYTGRNLLYTNDVLQFSNLAVRNAWFSGGVEWNIGIIGHNPFTTEPLYTAQTVNEDGEPVLRMYEYERIRKVTYQMDFWLEKDSSFLNCRMRIVNEGKEVVPMYWWSNMAVPEYENGRVVVPAVQAFTSRGTQVTKVDLPIVENIDISDYTAIKKSVDYFFDIPAGCPKYIANIDETGYGLFQISTDRLRSRKLFSWGNQDASNHWQEYLTDKAGRYLEIQAGLGKTQYGCIPMAPHTAWEWMEQYGSVQISEDVLEKEYRERTVLVTEKILETGLHEKLKEKLETSKETSRKKAQTVYRGSGYGALTVHGESTKHLEFSMKAVNESQAENSKEEAGLEKWKHFFETGILHCPKPLEAPDEFMIDETNVDFLEAHMEENAQSWYAYYQLGLGYYRKEDYGKAEKAFEDSLKLRESAWAFHGLSCVKLMQNEKDQAGRYILQGMAFERKELSYLKEGFRILLLAEKYEELSHFYRKLDKEEQEDSRLKLGYVQALHGLKQDKKALDLLESKGGLIPEDIREGEDSLGKVWKELYKSVYKKEGKLPHKFNFQAN